jgi:hypothetical protein
MRYVPRRRHPKRPRNDERFKPMESVLLLVFISFVANKLLMDYQTNTTLRGHVYALALDEANKKFKRGPERAALRRLITMAHHACFNQKAIT